MDSVVSTLQQLALTDYKHYSNELQEICDQLQHIEQQLNTENDLLNLSELSIQQTPTRIHNTSNTSNTSNTTNEPIYTTPPHQNPFDSILSDLPPMPQFKTPFKAESSFNTQSSNSMPNIPEFKTPAAKFNSMDSFNSITSIASSGNTNSRTNSILTPIKRKFDITMLPIAFQEPIAKQQVLMVYELLSTQLKWTIKELMTKLPLSREKIELIVRVFIDKGFIKNGDVVSM